MPRRFDLILFGATSDLALRKLLPSIYRAFREKKIAKNSHFYLCCRQRKNFNGLMDIVKKSLSDYMAEAEFNDDETWNSFSTLIQPIQIDVNDSGSGWQTLKERLSVSTDCVRVFYLAIPPTLYSQCCHLLTDHNLITKKSRLVVEKPIGYNMHSAEKINVAMTACFEEQQIYRIDHYLGKETVQNLLVLRFSNSLFERFWHASFIDHIQISINESAGVEGRQGFYDDVGALRDMVQSHLLQLLCLVAMDSPSNLSAKNIRHEKIKVLQSLRPLRGKMIDRYTVRGQYGASNDKNQKYPGYLQDLGITKSSTETFVAIKAYIDNWHWANVPFYLRTGKRLSRQSAEIVIQFKDISHNLYQGQQKAMMPNRMIIQLQPRERLQLIVMTKDMTKLNTELKPAVLDLNFTDQIDGYRSYAYKRLLLDVVDGNDSLFLHRDEITEAWRWIDPIVEYWQQAKMGLPIYPCGTMGPKSADELIERDGRYWVDIN